MLFNSLEFAVFFAICGSLYGILPHRAQNRLLLAASYVFYAAWDWRFLGLILASTLIDYTVGLRLEAADDPRRRRQLLGISVVANLSLLGAFKYAGFFAGSLMALFGRFGLALPPTLFDVILPVGISFYTFQTLSYTIDIYRREMRPTRSLLDFALFVAFFPQLVAGPIERARRLLPQVLAPRQVGFDAVGSGGWLVFWGIFKKVAIADNLAPLADAVFAPGAHPTGLEVWMGCYAFGLQIYCDFSGYSDIARGAARMLGFDLTLNFRIPYGAVDIADFWRRWHISLSTWFRDYLYIPLGGNRRRVDRNLLATMAICGLWHGAAWHYVFWGVYHGVLLVLSRRVSPWLGRFAPASGAGRAAWTGLRVLLTFQLVSLGWVFFRAESLDQSLSLAATMFTSGAPGLAAAWIAPLALLAAPLVLMQIVQAASGDLERILRFPAAARVAVYLALIAGLLVFGEDNGAEFIYFQF